MGNFIFLIYFNYEYVHSIFTSNNEICILYLNGNIVIYFE